MKGDSARGEGLHEDQAGLFPRHLLANDTAEELRVTHIEAIRDEWTLQRGFAAANFPTFDLGGMGRDQKQRSRKTGPEPASGSELEGGIRSRAGARVDGCVLDESPQGGFAPTILEPGHEQHIDMLERMLVGQAARGRSRVGIRDEPCMDEMQCTAGRDDDRQALLSAHGGADGASEEDRVDALIAGIEPSRVAFETSWSHAWQEGTYIYLRMIFFLDCLACVRKCCSIQ